MYMYVTERSENTPGRVDSGRVDSGADLTSGRVDPLPHSASVGTIGHFCIS